MSPSSSTSSATSSRTLAARALPSISCAGIGVRLRKNGGMADRLPRKNDPASIAARREALRLDGEVDISPHAEPPAPVTCTAVIPVSVAQMQISLGDYVLSEDGDVVETGRGAEEVTVPLAHSEGG